MNQKTSGTSARRPASSFLLDYLQLFYMIRIFNGYFFTFAWVLTNYVTSKNHTNIRHQSSEPAYLFSDIDIELTT